MSNGNFPPPLWNAEKILQFYYMYSYICTVISWLGGVPTPYSIPSPERRRGRRYSRNFVQGGSAPRSRPLPFFFFFFFFLTIILPVLVCAEKEHFDWLPEHVLN